ncbi:MAG TPA: 16S rRNA (cytidine(1402)-2'-O)-methyltransferase [Candidatus Limnocylindrales bacterium]|nr:16S rRNA (cytidine(1402)-2'-O)-methyltransferase [Candidatus Limnocylindrales bacterium]
MAARPAGTGDPEGGTLYVVATPIGNLGDVTLRALEVLRAVPLVAAEDTRITHRLLERYEIATRTTSYHAQSGPSKERELLAHLGSGSDLALVTDAGTPVVSDPGEGLVAAWAAAGGRIVALPGASSVLAAVASAGVAGPRWSFEGFLPRSGRERKERLAAIAADERGAVLFEGPNRVGATLVDLAAACGGDRPGAVCRELTKIHEQVVRGTLGELAGLAADGTIPARGEVVIVVGWGRGSGAIHGLADAREGALASARTRVEALVADGVARGEAARRVAKETGLARRALYGADGAPAPSAQPETEAGVPSA